jgi:hypothetical protein
MGEALATFPDCLINKTNYIYPSSSIFHQLQYSILSHLFRLLRGSRLTGMKLAHARLIEK